MTVHSRVFKVVGQRPIRPDGIDKVTGGAQFGADLPVPGALVGRVLRSPHPHARLVSVDVSKALAIPGVKAVITSDDLPNLRSEMADAGESQVDLRDVSENVLARGKVLYDGHPIAAVAATTPPTARGHIRAVVGRAAFSHRRPMRRNHCLTCTDPSPHRPDTNRLAPTGRQGDRQTGARIDFPLGDGDRPGSDGSRGCPARPIGTT